MPVVLAVQVALAEKDLAVLEATVVDAAEDAILGKTTTPAGRARPQDVEHYLSNPGAKKDENRLGDLYKLKLPDRSGCRTLRTRGRTGR